MKQCGVHREVTDWCVVDGPRRGLKVRRNLSCGHVTDKRFSTMDRHEYNTIGQPFRRPRFAFCLQCSTEST